VALGSELPAGPIVIGDGVAFGEDIAIGLTHGSSQGPIAGVAWIAADVRVARIVDIGPTLSDAPPPRMAPRAGGLVAAYYARLPTPEQTGARRLALVAIQPPGAPAVHPLAMSSQQGDESLAFDLGFSQDAGLVVWDEVASARAAPPVPIPTTAGRGVIRGAVIDGDMRVGAAFDVSPAESDAESPRLVHGSSGFFVFWIASASEQVAQPDAEPGRTSSEAIGEARTNGWIEMTALDFRGAPKGPVARLTSERGHVSSYDVLGLERGVASTIVVVARDDGEVADGTGGTLLLVRANENGTDTPVTITSGGLGRGAPAIVDARPPWVTWAGDREELRVLPLAPTGRPAAAASVEESLGEARPLLGMVSSTTAPPQSPSSRILAVIPAPKDENVPSAAVVVCAAP
jgi:hypothetical protein